MQSGLAGEFADVYLREKLCWEFAMRPYRKPTQVNRSSRPRQTGNGGLRNSAKKLGVTSGYALPRFARSQQTFINRLFSKNTGSCKPETGRIGAETCPVLVS